MTVAVAFPLQDEAEEKMVEMRQTPLSLILCVVQDSVPYPLSLSLPVSKMVTRPAPALRECYREVTRYQHPLKWFLRQRRRASHPTRKGCCWSILGRPCQIRGRLGKPLKRDLDSFCGNRMCSSGSASQSEPVSCRPLVPCSLHCGHLPAIPRTLPT